MVAMTVRTRHAVLAGSTEAGWWWPARAPVSMADASRAAHYYPWSRHLSMALTWLHRRLLRADGFGDAFEVDFMNRAAAQAIFTATITACKLTRPNASLGF